MGASMIGLVKEHRGYGATLKEVPVPTCGDDEVLVRVQATSICGTDLHIYKWDAWAERTVITPNVFGHEFAGTVVEVGARAAGVRVGDYVSAEGHMVCGTCKACRTGNAHVCPNTKSFGITAPGCFAEYAIVKASNIIHNDANLPSEIACLQDPLGNAVQTVLSGDIVGKTVAIIGVGPIGLLAIKVAKACGAGAIYAVDINPNRLQMARQMGADSTIHALETRTSEALRALTGGEGVDVVLEMSGNPQAIVDGFAAAANAGRVSLLGIPTQEVSLDITNQIIFKGLKVEGITGRKMYQTWYQMKGLLNQHRLDLASVITHKFKLDQYEEAFQLMNEGQCGKIVFIH
ncbi:L-threonine 3-dehydrogenase [Paenibacillus sp. SYP-B3998]|uniref:L-threonine 3-dehydrogenase n=1 Tax=Paenibacillus sp. SYP-B3998 TaxID=2678564 RepID=A0A6G3ZSH2_9BACL|nr:L-threonine 3-dehydrogenase [Paenibacillus sp. SYP-B3998]NEW04988.1 L-threonine 3-dehydrogenase [Paenibacillus sp. SYP-B3998]